MIRASLVALAVVFHVSGAAEAQAPVPSYLAQHGLAGSKPGLERWNIHFTERSFDLLAFRTANRERDANKVAAVVADLEQRVVRDQAGFAKLIESLGGEMVEQFWLINACAVEIDPKHLPKLRAFVGVWRVAPDLAAYPVILKATDSRNHDSDKLNSQGFKGAGVTAAIMDTGQDGDMGGIGRPHRTYFPEGNLSRPSRLILNKQMGSVTAEDTHGHGTGVSGIVAGGHWGTAAADHGHAPLADIAGYSISNNAGSGSSSLATMAKAWQEIAKDAVQYSIVTANNSYSGSNDPLNVSQQALDACAWNADVMVIVAAANSGASTSMSQPALNGLAVGAVTADAHVVANFSSRGPHANDPARFYPDIAACGVDTVMPRYDSETKDWTASGTSMAAPQVCGAATLIRSALPMLSAGEVKAVLLASALDISTKNPGLTRNDFGMGLLRDTAAMGLAGSAQGHGQASVTTAMPTFQMAMPVQAGRTYRCCVTWMRQVMSSVQYSNLDVEILDGQKLIASSSTPRNLYELVGFRVQKTGTVTLRVKGLSIEGGSQPFAWAFGEGSLPPLASSYQPFGVGCAGAPQGCVQKQSTNWLQALSGATTTAPQVAFFEAMSEDLNLCGVEIFCRSKSGTVNVTISVSDVNSLVFGAGGPMASVVVPIGPIAQAHKINFPSVKILKNHAFLIVLDHADQLILPAAPSGSSRFHYEYLNGVWKLVFSPAAWQSRIYADPGQQVPVMKIVGAPVLGTSFSLELENAPSMSLAFLVSGVSDQSWGAIPLPFNFGANCNLLTAVDFVLSGTTDLHGKARLSMLVPQLPSLVGVSVFHQYLVVDSANASGLISSNAGESVIGDF